MIWVTADQHLNHKGIIEQCNRPFKNLAEMNHTLIKNHNDVVAPNDKVYILGDMIGPAKHPGSINPQDILAQLNGRLYYIYSQEYTHEEGLLGCERFFEERHAILVIKEGRKHITFCHYPMDSWPKSFYGSYHCHGHSHSKMNSKSNRLDAGVDGHNFFPWSMREIFEHMEKPENKKRY